MTLPSTLQHSSLFVVMVPTGPLHYIRSSPRLHEVLSQNDKEITTFCYTTVREEGSFDSNELQQQTSGYFLDCSFDSVRPNSRMMNPPERALFVFFCATQVGVTRTFCSNGVKCYISNYSQDMLFTIFQPVTGKKLYLLTLLTHRLFD